MKKLPRILIIIISSLILVYGVFVGVECVRLYNVRTSKPPIVVTRDTQILENEIKYTGLGYTVIYEAREGNPTGGANIPICGAEFRLFDKILLWAWIE